MAATTAEPLAELRDKYEAFLRNERFHLTDRIATAIDDYQHVLAQSSGKDAAALASADASAKTTAAAASCCPRVTLRMAELRGMDRGETATRLRQDPFRHLRALEAACHVVASEERPGYDKEGVKIKVAIEGPVGAAPSSPRQLTSALLRQLVCVEGVATQVSTIKPKVVQSVHYCPNTQQHERRDYVDATDPLLGLPVVDAQGQELPDRVIHMTSSVYPTTDADGNPLETEFGWSTFKDHQTVVLQELPEKAPMGQLPRSVPLVLELDWVDRIKPGDRVHVTGVYRALAPNSVQGMSSTSGRFQTVLLVNHVQIVGRDVNSSHLNFSTHDIRTIRSLSQRPDILSLLGRSMAPSIHGHAVIKKALALQLLAGVEKNLDNGTHLRGDINILMVGDPSTAKSQLLRSAMTIAPLAVSTTGKGSSGVGLTAAVTSDPDTRERRLEAGAMVLADRGLVCVDEFDKMGENDRVAIHEAMEQQTVTIAKAGLHASLNARCAVLAAANPVYGQYDRRRRIQENIGLPDSLLSRFDLLFVVLDQMDPQADRKIAAHVIRGHRYRPNHGQAGHDSDYDDDDSDRDDDDEDDLLGERQTEKTHSVWQRRSHHLYDDNGEEVDDADCQKKEVLQHDFLRKYLHFAKTRQKPVLTDTSRDFIANRYAEMRARQDEQRTLPITARSLETVIRLATAHAKARLSNTVEPEPDCQAAMDILSFALYHENIQPHSKPPASSDKKRVLVSDTGESEEDEHDGDDDDEDDDGTSSNKKRARSDATADADATEQDAALRHRIWQRIAAKDGEIDVADLLSTLGEQGDDEATVQSALDSMYADGKLMESDGVLYQLD